MHICDDLRKECNTVREPVCGRGGPVTAYSVTGTGPGMACSEEETETTETTVPERKTCKVSVTVNNKVVYKRNGSGVSIKTC